VHIPTGRSVAALALLACIAVAVTRVAGAHAPARARLAGVTASESTPTDLTSWTLREDPADRGLAWGWQRGGFAGASVGVPNTLRAGAYKGAAGIANYEGSVAWYRTSLHAPSTGTYLLGFQSASFFAQAWVDGRSLGAHRGAYLPFALRAQLGAGTHEIVVRVDWRDPGRQSREGFHRTWFNWGGLNGPVTVRELGASELSNPQLQTTLTGGEATVRVSVRVRNDGPARSLQPEGSLTHGHQRLGLTFPTLTLEPGESATATATVTVAEPALWSPAEANLYQLRLAVGQESSYTAQVGLRALSWHSGRLYLNGHRLLLHGATIQEDAAGHGDALTAPDEARIVSELKAIGANAVRAQHPLSPSLLDRLDAAGVLVWQGVGPVEGAGNWYSTTPQLLATAEQQAKTAVLAEQLHPSVIDWNLVDEVAGNGRNGAEVSYVRTLAHWLHAHDPGRMVSVDVWGDHPPASAGPLYAEADAVAETDYSGWYDNPHDSPAQLAAQMHARLAAMKRTFPGKVLAISEFGAESNRLNAPAAPGGYGYQARLLAQHIAVYTADPKLTGMMIWLLRDYPLTPTFQGGSIHGVLPQVRLIEGLNQKGLFTYGGTAKPAVATVARLFGALPRG
jgi:hypothetical protein